MPGCSIKPFCDAPIATLTPSASIANGAAPSEATTSTTNSAGCPAASIARRSAARSERGAAGGVGVHREDRRDAVAGVVAQHGLDRGRIDRQPFDVRRAQRDAAERLDLLGPAVGEVTGARHQDRRARRDQVRDHGFPAAVAVRRVEEDLGARRLQQVSHARLAGGDQRGDTRVGQIGRLPRHRGHHFIGHMGRARRMQRSAAGNAGLHGPAMLAGRCLAAGLRALVPHSPWRMASGSTAVQATVTTSKRPRHLHWRPPSIGRSAMDPKKPPVPRRVWRMTTDSPQGEIRRRRRQADRCARTGGREADVSSREGWGRPAAANVGRDPRSNRRAAKPRSGC